MRQAPIPENEEHRLAELYAYGLLDTEPDVAFDRLTRAICTTFQVPISTITLVDRYRQWFKAARGIQACETARDISFCGHVVYQGQALVVEDTHQDERFHDNPLVQGSPYIRFYAGVPLTTVTGHHIGVACAQDRQPRLVRDDEIEYLHDIAYVATELAQLRRIEHFLERERQLFMSGPTLIFRWRYEPGWPIVYVSANVADVLGYNPLDLLGHAFVDLVHPADQERMVYEVNPAANQHVSRYEHEPYRLRNAQGHYRWVQSSIIVEHADGGSEQVVYGYINDITDRIALEEELRYCAYYDELTGLANRWQLESALEQERERAERYRRPVSLIFLDLDRFKALNDTYGHDAGDRVLERLAAACRARLRRNDLAGRWGGEEFLVLLPETPCQQALEVAEALRQGIQEGTGGDGIPEATISAGVAALQQEETVKAWLERVDSALYRAKQAGRNQVCT